jgi:hypothetical protein
MIHRLLDTAAAAQTRKSPEQILHKRLLEQLNDYEELSSLSPEELLAELQIMQLAAVYEGGCSLSHKTKALGSGTEEFLVQQVGMGAHYFDLCYQ